MGKSIISGKRPIEELLRSERPISVQAIYYSNRCPVHLLEDIKARFSGFSIIERSPKDLEAAFPGINHQGIVIEIADPKAKGDWKHVLLAGGGPFLALDRIQDPQNLGSILRSAEAYGLKEVFLTGRGAGITATVHRVSAGATMYLTIFDNLNLDQLMLHCKKEGIWTIVTDGEGEVTTTELDKMPASRDLLLIIGSEGEGVKDLAKRKADFRLRIPLHGNVESLNAGVATAVCLERLVNRDD